MLIIKGLAAHWTPFALSNNIKASFKTNNTTLSFACHWKESLFHNHYHHNNHNLYFVKLNHSDTPNMEAHMEIIKEAIQFDNVTLNELLKDSESIDENYPRTVMALQANVKPTPLKKPRLVCWSNSAAKCVNIDKYRLEENPTFIEALAGNICLPGSEPVAHNYCGHQFGYFAGQLGDGAAINLGEFIVKPESKNEDENTPRNELTYYGARAKRCFLQLKGSGLTPFSRTADGRKVLRSSIREFLCSEAMHHLGIPTTRALCIIKSDDTVGRDMFYDGNVKEENCAVVCRLSETFFRFGTFELFKPMDSNSNRSGPCVGMHDIKQKLLDYTIKQYFQEMRAEVNPLSELTPTNNETRLQTYAQFFTEVVVETAKLVGAWESIGFCHGVLNTDNMSIKSLTIDYGPFGFMERFDRNLITNTSDDGGRYRFQQQPEIVMWNLEKLAEALDPLVPVTLGKHLVSKNFMHAYNKFLYRMLYQKLGFLHNIPASEQWSKSTFDQMDEVISSFFSTMEKTCSDFTNSFRCLSSLILPGLPGHDSSKKALVDLLVKESVSLKTLIAETMSEINKPQNQFTLRVVDKNDPNDLSLLQMLGIDPARAIRTRLRYKELLEATEEEIHQDNNKHWTCWVEQYCEFLREHFSSDDLNELDQIQMERNRRMDSTNPKFILRNHVMQKAIDAAEKDDFRMTRLLLFLSENSFKDINISEARETVPDISEEEFASLYRQGDPERRIKVSCSS